MIPYICRDEKKEKRTKILERGAKQRPPPPFFLLSDTLFFSEKNKF